MLGANRSGANKHDLSHGRSRANTSASAVVNGHGDLPTCGQEIGDFPAGGHGLCPRTDMAISVEAVFEVRAHAGKDSPNEIAYQ